MREILFRGKLTERFADAADSRVDLVKRNVIKDGFVYGSLVVDDGKCYICTSAYAWNKSYVNNSDATMFEVDPETVGQYTGSSDKNRTKIFEGDVVRAITRFTDIYVEAVTFKDGAFWYKNWSWFKFGFKFEKAEVIGNIYENPELLGEPMKPASKNVAQSGLAQIVIGGKLQ